jgi:RimJ/RimL family protein N-acetyltransferase
MKLTNDIDKLGPWAWKLMGVSEWYPEGKTALGEIIDGEPIWAVIYEGYHPGGSIKMHVAISDPKYVSRRAISAVFEYPFYQLNVKKVLGVVNSENHAALTFDLRIGFTIETVIKDAYDRGDMYILSMTQEQCRWLRGNRDGSRKRAAAA